IASALNYTKTLFNYPETAKIVLVTDGKETDGKAASVARSVSASGVRIDIANIPSEYSDTDVQITDVKLPNYHVNIGNECLFGITVHSRADEGYKARITLSDNDSESEDGKSVLEDKMIVSGAQEFEIPYTFKEGGEHKLVFSVELTDMENEPLLANNTYTAFMSIENFNKILVLQRDDSSSEALADILTEGDAFDVETKNFFDEDIPYTVKQLREYDQVILDNVSVTDMKDKWEGDEEKAEEFQQALYRYVYDYGGSVFTVGGDDESGNANFYDRIALARDYATPLRQMLPVQAVEYTPPLGVVIIIDKSGSMDETLAVGSTRENRLWWARAGATSCLNSTDFRDYIGIMTLDEYNEVILPLTPRTQRDKITTAIESIDTANGGTIATNALISARAQLISEYNSGKIEKKHIIIVTDGEIAKMDTAIDAAAINYKNGITMSIVQIGGSSSGKNISLRIIAAGNGYTDLESLKNQESSVDLSEYEKYLYEDDNKIIYNMREDLHQHGIDDVIYKTFKPVIYSPSSNLVQGLGETDPSTFSRVLPAELDGFYGTKARDESELILVGEYDVPVYAQWKFGKGMVGSFMCDIGGKWGSGFATEESGRIFIRNVVGNLVPTEDIREKGIVLDLREENYVNQLNVFTELNEGETISGTITDISTAAETEKPLITPENAENGEAGFYVLTGFSKENSYSRSTFVVKKSGVYKLTVEKKDSSGNIIETVVKYKTFSYSKEYDAFTGTETSETDAFLSTLALRGNGSVIKDLEDPVEVFKDFVTELVKTYDPRILFMILSIILFLLDIIVRKFKFKWPHEIAAWIKENRELKKK
ncbi:MAG: VWA domain-containing protein, partial [Clostridia bacterium]|nr:VWA domain-containing protein [Clostridia bacterium]